MGTTDPKKLAILVGGGPAPGINSVISAVTIRSLQWRIGVLGIRDGFKWLARKETKGVLPLTYESINNIHLMGGSILGTARDNPTKDPQHLENVTSTLLELNVDKLVTIGGDDTAYSASRVEEAAKGTIHVVHVPKTIDNDLDLPHGIPTFGFQTARHIGVSLVRNLMIDAATTHRWYVVVAMGRKAGHLALGIGKAAGVPLTLISEEFEEPQLKLSKVIDTIVGSVLMRLSQGHNDGVVVLAEGILERIDPSDLKELENVERDQHDNIRYSTINFADIINKRLSTRLTELGIKITTVGNNIGYELRCADPIPFDIEYTRDLGYCAAEFIIGGGTGAMVSIQNGRFKPMYFREIMNPQTKKTNIRMVDIKSETYNIARQYMVRLRKKDLDDSARLKELASFTNLSPEKFRETFSTVV